MSPINYPDDAYEPGHTNADAVRQEASTDPQAAPPEPREAGWSNAKASRVEEAPATEEPAAPPPPA